VEQTKKNKQFILEYVNAISGQTKTRELLEIYNGDPGLVETIMFFDSVFPKYEYNIDEMLAEGDRVMVRARLKARHEAEFLGIPATHREVEFQFVVGYELQNNKIVHSWLVPDNLALLEQIRGKEQPANKV
jgi:predicted ester cyclase